MPLSAIDWLSESVATDPSTPIAPPIELFAKPPHDVTVAALDGALPDLAGMLDAADIGVSPRLWGRSSAADLSRALSVMPMSGPPSLRRLKSDLMVARLDAPIDAAGDDALFLARVDKLLEAGHLDRAAALLDLVGVNEPQRFRRWFDIALLRGTEDTACDQLEAIPELSPTYPARIFCLARNGEWDVAALTLGNAEALNILSPYEDQVFLHFLEPEVGEEQELPPFANPTPLFYRIYEAVGERPETHTLPVAFAHADLSDRVGWKTRLRGAERLAASGALSGGALIALMQEHGAAASGGVWERVDALSDLSDEVEAGRIRAATLSRGWGAAREGGYRAAIAEWIAPTLSTLDTANVTSRAAFEAAVFVDDPALAARFVTDDADRLVVSLLSGGPAVGAPQSGLGRAVVAGLSPGPLPESAALLIDDARGGEALIAALTHLSDGAAGDPAAVERALRTLVHLGATDAARRIGAELLLEGGEA